MTFENVFNICILTWSRVETIESVLRLSLYVEYDVVYIYKRDLLLLLCRPSQQRHYCLKCKRNWGVFPLWRTDCGGSVQMQQKIMNMQR